MAAVSNYSEQEVVAILDEYAAGVSREAICEHYGITVRTFFRWQAKHGRSRPYLRQCLTALQEENLRLKAQLDGAQASDLPPPNRKFADLRLRA